MKATTAADIALVPFSVHRPRHRIALPTPNLVAVRPVWASGLAAHIVGDRETVTGFQLGRRLTHHHATAVRRQQNSYVRMWHAAHRRQTVEAQQRGANRRVEQVRVARDGDLGGDFMLHWPR